MVASRSLQDFNQKNKYSSPSPSMIEDRRKILQQFIQDIALVPSIKESCFLKQFLGIDNYFPELCQNLEFTPSISLPRSSQQSLPAPAENVNQKLISELFGKSKQGALGSHLQRKQEDLVKRQQEQLVLDTAESKREQAHQETFAPQAQLEEEEEDDELCQSTLTPQKYECVMHPSDMAS